MTVHLRKGRQGDVGACIDILSSWVDELDWGPALNPRAQLETYWSGYFEAACTWVAVCEGTVVGFCLRHEDNIGALYVAAGLRGAGIGKQLLDAAKEGRDWITVWAYADNTDALRFYRREGLVEVAREVEAETGLVDIEHRWTRSH